MLMFVRPFIAWQLCTMSSLVATHPSAYIMYQYQLSMYYHASKQIRTQTDVLDIRMEVNVNLFWHSYYPRVLRRHFLRD